LMLRAVGARCVVLISRLEESVGIGREMRGGSREQRRQHLGLNKAEVTTA
jgi:hypothetical protein